MTTTAINHHAETEDLLRHTNRPYTSIGFARGRFSAHTYEPADVVRGTCCYGEGPTIAAAWADMFAKVEEVKAKGKVLATAAECKAAVVALINEHEAAPASFRDAVDALQVKG